jgi:GTP-binding protein HflX
LSAEKAEEIRQIAEQDASVEVISAQTGEGVLHLLARLGELLTSGALTWEFVLPVSEGRKIAWLHAHGEVLEDEDAGEGMEEPSRRILVRLNPKEAGQFETL